MAGPDEYTARVAIPGEVPTGAPRIGIPDLPGGQQVGAAISGLGNAGVNFAAQMIRAQTVTAQNTMLANYLKGDAELQKQFQEDPDYETAAARYSQARKQLEDGLISTGTFGRTTDPATKAKLDLAFTRHAITADRSMEAFHVKKQADVNVAALNEYGLTQMAVAANAKSDVERGAAIKEFNDRIDETAAAGWISVQSASGAKLKFMTTLETRDAMVAIRDNPLAAEKELRDPAKFTAIEPIHRETLITHATAARNQAVTDQIVATGRRDPVAASLMLGRVASPGHDKLIYDAVVMPIESGGDPNAVSTKGAVGLGQMIPATAREMAGKLGMADIAALDDAGIKKAVLANPKLGYQLGLAYWQEMLDRYSGAGSGQIPLALAAYNAGPGNKDKPRADAWWAQAKARFGDNFSPAQLQSVIGVAETRDYVGKAYAKLGVALDGPGLSPHAMFGATERVRGELNQEITGQRQAYRELAAVQRQDEGVVGLLKKGFIVDPDQWIATERAQEDAAAAGDPAARKYLRDMEIGKKYAPVVQGLYGMAPAARDASLAALEGELRSRPATKEEVGLLDAMKAVRHEIDTNKNHDPIALLERGYRAAPVLLDPKAAPTDPEFTRSMAVRNVQSQRAADLYGAAFMPFKVQEAEAWKQRWAQAGEGERVALIKSFGEGFADERVLRGAIKQLGAPDLVATAAVLGRDRPDLAREILHGAAVLGEKGVTTESKFVHQALAEKVKGELYPDPKMQSEVVKASLAVYASQRGANATLYEPADAVGIEAAVERVAGQIINRSGRQVAVPIGMRSSDFEQVLNTLNVTDLNIMGGAYDSNGKPADPAYVGRNARLIQQFPGSQRYFVTLPGPTKDVPLRTRDGDPLVFDMRVLGTLLPEKYAASMTPWQQARHAAQGQRFESAQQFQRDLEAQQ